MSTHKDIDAHSLALHRAVARRLREDPAQFERVKATLQRWHHQAPWAFALIETSTTTIG